MKKFKLSLDKAVLIITSVLLIFMVSIVFIQVIARYVFHNSLSWSEEIARYLLVWLIFLSAGYVIGQRAHIFLDFVFSLFPPRIQKAFSQITNVLLLGFSILVTLLGCVMVQVGTMQRSSALEIPMWIIYLAIPSGGILLSIYILMEIFFKQEAECK